MKMKAKDLKELAEKQQELTQDLLLLLDTLGKYVNKTTSVMKQFNDEMIEEYKRKLS